MSLNSLINDKLNAKRSEIRSKYAAQTKGVEDKYRLGMEKTRKSFEDKLQKLLNESKARFITLEISRSYDLDKVMARATVSIGNPGLKKVKDEIYAREKEELKKFVGIDEKAQLSALLPAKERREEMAAILAEIAKF